MLLASGSFCMSAIGYCYCKLVYVSIISYQKLLATLLYSMKFSLKLILLMAHSLNLNSVYIYLQEQFNDSVQKQFENQNSLNLSISSINPSIYYFELVAKLNSVYNIIQSGALLLSVFGCIGIGIVIGYCYIDNCRCFWISYWLLLLGIIGGVIGHCYQNSMENLDFVIGYWELLEALLDIVAGN